MEVDQKKAILSFCKELMVTARKNYNWTAFWTYHDKIEFIPNQIKKPTCGKQAG
ncbi:hypothetical protein [Brevibacillus laterosporus]|uniref:hypothetical protein n=1 Tax=Brevibacillus laterosporus TaxID=1465 RepID=UPI003D1EE123